MLKMTLAFFFIFLASAELSVLRADPHFVVPIGPSEHRVLVEQVFGEGPNIWQGFILGIKTPPTVGLTADGFLKYYAIPVYSAPDSDTLIANASAIAAKATQDLDQKFADLKEELAKTTIEYSK